MDFFEYLYGTIDKTLLIEKLNGVMAGELYEEFKIYSAKCGAKGMGSKKFNEKIRNEYGLQTVNIRVFQDNGNPTYRAKFVKPELKKVSV